MVLFRGSGPSGKLSWWGIIVLGIVVLVGNGWALFLSGGELSSWGVVLEPSNCPHASKHYIQSVAYNFDISFLVSYTHACFNLKPLFKGTDDRSPAQANSVSGDNDVYILVVIYLIILLNKMLKC